MVALAVEGIDLLKIAGRSISGWIPSFKTGAASHVRQPFCSQLEERLLLYLEYHPQVTSYARGDIGTPFAKAYRLPIEAKRFLDGSTLLVECPNCAATRSLEPRRGVLRFPSHDKRKTRTLVTSQRWAIEETIWEVVGGERK